MPSSVRKLIHPTSSSSPKTPQLESGGAPGLTGNCEKRGILLKSILAIVVSSFGYLPSGRRNAAIIVRLFVESARHAPALLVKRRPRSHAPVPQGRLLVRDFGELSIDKRQALHD